MSATILLLSVLAASLPASPAAEEGAQAQASSGGLLLVLHKAEATLALYDPADGSVVASAPTGVGPHEVAVSPDGGLAVVADYGQQAPGKTLTVYDLRAREVARTIDLGEHRRPHGIAFLDEDEVLVTCEQSRAIVRVDVVRGAVVAAIPTDQQAAHMVALAPSGRRAYVANIVSGTLSVLDLEAGSLLASVETGAGAEGLAVAPGGATVWVGNRAADTLSIVDAGEGRELAELACAGFPIRVAFTPDGKRVLVSCAQAGAIAVFDAAERKELVRVELGVEAATEQEGRFFGGRFGESPVPVGILVEPTGKRAYVACANADLVLVLDLERLAVAARIPTGREPDGMAWCP